MTAKAAIFLLCGVSNQLSLNDQSNFGAGDLTFERFVRCSARICGFVSSRYSRNPRVVSVNSVHQIMQSCSLTWINALRNRTRKVLKAFCNQLSSSESLVIESGNFISNVSKKTDSPVCSAKISALCMNHI